MSQATRILNPGERVRTYRIDRLLSDDDACRRYLVSDTSTDQAFVLEQFTGPGGDRDRFLASGSGFEENGEIYRLQEWRPGESARPTGSNSEVETEGREWLPMILLGILAVLLLSAIVYLFSDNARAPSESPNPSSESTEDGLSPAAPPTPGSGEERRRWETALDTDTLFAYELFISDFPESAHVDQARRHIERLDQNAWQAAQADGSRKAIEGYLSDFPDGSRKADALIALDRLSELESAENEAQLERERSDDEAWLAASNARSLPAIDRYLANWPQGLHIEEARELRRQLDREADDRRAFEAAQKTNSLAAYRDYLGAFPQGMMAAEALEAIEDLTLRPGKTFRDCESCPTMVVVPAGAFWQGSEDDAPMALKMEKPRRMINIAEPFAVGVFEITMEQWDRCVADDVCSTNPPDNGWGRADRPVIMVSWNDAQEYTAWLSRKTGQAYSLPSESQWEYFARAGEASDWLGGDPAKLCEFANIAGAESGFRWQHESCADGAALETLPVGSLKANAFGLHDVIGNVAEWTNDCMNLSYLDAPADGSAWGRGICSSHMTRGGSWFTGTREVRLPARFNLKNGDRNDFTGFRVVRKVEPQ